MVRKIEGRIACRISLAPDSSGFKYYCDYCSSYFDDRHSPACEKEEREDAAREAPKKTFKKR